MRAPRMRHGRGAGVGVGLCVLSHAGQCVALDWTMIELGCRGTQTARQCVAWGDAAGAPANATCALYPGEATGWCWVDAAHNEWEYCDGACRGADAESAGDIILRDVQQSPAILRAAALMHRTEPDMAGAAKALAKVVTANRQVVEDHWSKGGKGVVRNLARNTRAVWSCCVNTLGSHKMCTPLQATQNIRRAVVVSAHATFMLASISKVRVSLPNARFLRKARRTHAGSRDRWQWRSTRLPRRSCARAARCFKTFMAVRFLPAPALLRARDDLGVNVV